MADNPKKSGGSGLGGLFALAGFLALIGGMFSLPLHLFLWLKTGEPVHLDVVSVANHFESGGWWAYPQSWFGFWKLLHWLHVSIFLGGSGLLAIGGGIVWSAVED